MSYKIGELYRKHHLARSINGTVGRRGIAGINPINPAQTEKIPIASNDTLTIPNKPYTEYSTALSRIVSFIARRTFLGTMAIDFMAQRAFLKSCTKISFKISTKYT